MSGLVTNPEDRFSRDETHLYESARGMNKVAITIAGYEQTQ